MTRFTPKTLATLTAFGLATVATPAGAQSAMTPAQCDTMMMVGTQNYAASAVAGCTSYFQTLARNAAAPGTFGTVSPGATSVVISTSGTGG